MLRLRHQWPRYFLWKAKSLDNFPFTTLLPKSLGNTRNSPSTKLFDNGAPRSVMTFAATSRQLSENNINYYKSAYLNRWNKETLHPSVFLKLFLSHQGLMTRWLSPLINDDINSMLAARFSEFYHRLFSLRWCRRIIVDTGCSTEERAASWIYVLPNLR